MRGFRPSRLSGDSEEHQRLMIEFREQRVREYQEKIKDGEGIFETAPRSRHRSPRREKGMETIRYRCRRCNSLLENDAQLAGQEETCPVCRCVTIVPERPKAATPPETNLNSYADDDDDVKIIELDKQLNAMRLTHDDAATAEARSREPNW